jgi:hypothetical protein
MIDATNTKGMNDGLQIDLLHLDAPHPGMQYYGWLLSDLDKFEGVPVSLGPMLAQAGVAHVRFVDSGHTDLLAQASRFLITEESASLAPASPSSDRSTWRYYAALPQQPGQVSMDGMRLSFLDHLRHLLVDDPDLASLSAHGGLAFWATENTRKILEWANAARGTGVPQSPDLMHRLFIRILDYLDGTSSVQQDLPAHTPFLADQLGGHFGLLTLDANASPAGYLQEIAMHLEGMVSCPGATDSERTLAGKLDTALSQTRNSLNQARQDSIKLVNTPEDQLQSPESTDLLDDLVLQANNAYIGLYDPQTGNRTQGITWITDQLQYLATFEVKPYTPGQSSSSQPSMNQTPASGQMPAGSQTPTMKQTPVSGQMPSGGQMPTPQATAKKM